MKEIFGKFDKSHQGYVNFVDIVAGMISVCDSPIEDRIMVGFSLMDIDSDGYITVQELERFIYAVLVVVSTCSPTAQEKLKIFGDVGIQILAHVATEKCLKTLNMTRNDKLKLESVSEFVDDCINIVR